MRHKLREKAERSDWPLKKPKKPYPWKYTTTGRGFHRIRRKPFLIRALRPRPEGPASGFSRFRPLSRPAMEKSQWTAPLWVVRFSGSLCRSGRRPPPRFKSKIPGKGMAESRGTLPGRLVQFFFGLGFFGGCLFLFRRLGFFLLMGTAAPQDQHQLFPVFRQQ